MDNYTSYTATRSNLFVWITVLLSLGSAAARIAYYVDSGFEGVFFFIALILLPVLANLFVAIRLPLRGAKMFFVTINPVIMYGVYFAVAVCAGSFKPLPVKLASVLLCVVLAGLYYMSFSGRSHSKLIVLVAFFLPIALVFTNGYVERVLYAYWMSVNLLFISDAAIYISVISAILSAKRLPPRKAGEPYRPRYGDRADGRRVHGLSPIAKVSPYIMVNRNGSSNMLRDKVEVGAMQRYVREKRRQGYKHFGIMHVLIATYVRCCNDAPAINRFLSGQRVYTRPEVIVNMIIKKDMTIEAPDTAVKLHCKSNATASEIYELFDKLVQDVKQPKLDSSFDNIVKIIDFIPGLIKKFAIWFLKTLDYFGLLPPELIELSPFHGSMFITSMGSLGIPPIFHHLYDFGNLPCFIAFGNKYTENELKSDGSVAPIKYIDLTVVADERICDGFYYATVLKKFRSYLLHPERLDEKPELAEDIY